jgi:hypothetical protein
MKPLFIISCPIDTYSGYGARSRDIVKAIIELDKYNVKILPQRWGSTSWDFIRNHPKEWGFLTPYLLPPGNNLPAKPEIWAQITVPNEFQRVGNHNIGITAGIETTMCDPSWLEGINRMDLTLVSSNHAKTVFQDCKYTKHDQSGNTVSELSLNKPVEVLFEGVDLTKYFPSKETNNFNLETVKEQFAYLFVGHWLQGDLGQDRKNVGLLIKMFYETFKDTPSAPALILKTSSGPVSYMDRDAILSKIDQIKNTIQAKSLPNVYLLHGEFTDEEINNLYNHKKIKAMVSLTKGEGFGRPLLEFSLTKKPIITTAWSGHTDFLDSKFTTLIKGQLEEVHPSAQVKNMILENSKWFTCDYNSVSYFLKDLFLNYDTYTKKSLLQYHKSKNNFNYEKMGKVLEEYLENYFNIPSEEPLTLPKLNLPKLKKIENVEG